MTRREVELDRLDLELIRIGDKLRAARKAAEDAYVEAERIAVEALAYSEFTEAGVAQQLGVDRMTVRKWQGKR